MDYHNLKKNELISYVKYLKKEIETLKDKQKIQNYIQDYKSYSYIKFNKYGIIQFSDNHYIYDEKINALRFKSLKEIKTADEKNLEYYFHLWAEDETPKTIKIKFNNTALHTYKCSFLKEDNTNFICVLSDITEIISLQEKYEVSEAKFRQIFDDLKIGISVLDKEFQIIFANKKMKEYFPHIVENAGMICFKTYNEPPKNEPCSYCPCLLTLKDGETHETITETPAGNTIRYFLLRSSPIKVDNEVVYIIELVEDITEKIKIEQSINFQDTFLKYLIDSIPAGIFYKDLNSKYIGCNKMFAEFFNLEPKDIINKTSFDIYNKEYAEEFERLDREIINSKVVKTYEFKLKNLKTQKTNHLLLHKAPFYDTNGDIKGIIGIVMDITEMKEIENKLQESSYLINELIEQTDSIVVNLDLEGNIRIFNKAAERITGYKREEVLGKNWFHIFVPPRKYPEVYQLFKEFTKRKTITRDYYVTYILTKSGEERLIRWRNNVFKKDNTVVGSTSIGVDITQQSSLLIDKLFSVIELIPHPIIVMDNNFVIEYMNSEYSKLTGYEPEELIGKNFRLSQIEDVNKVQYQDMLKTLRSGDTWTAEFLNQKKNGELYYERDFVSTIKDTKGNIQNYVAVKFKVNSHNTVSLDLTNNKSNNQKKSDDVYIQYYTFNSITNSIRSLINQIKITYGDSINVKEFIRKIDNIKNTLDLIQTDIEINTKGNNKKHKKVDFQKVLKELIKSTSSKSKDVKLILHKSKEKLFIKSDYSIIKNAINNLIQIIEDIISSGIIEINLIKGTKAQKSLASIHLLGKSENTIDKKMLLIKDNFYFLQNAFKPDPPLEIFKLHIIKRLLEKINCELDLEILNKKEIIFKLLFLETNGNYEKNITKKTLKKILLAEDNALNAEIMQVFLKDKFKIDSTTTAKETINKANKFKYDIFIIDIDLGNENDGIQIIKELKKLNQYSKTPFIAVTGYTDFKNKKTLFEAGFTDYLAKPFRKEQLLNLINKYT